MGSPVKLHAFHFGKPNAQRVLLYRGPIRTRFPCHDKIVATAILESSIFIVDFLYLRGYNDGVRKTPGSAETESGARQTQAVKPECSLRKAHSRQTAASKKGGSSWNALSAVL